jgi:bd-type cytochrome oxidase subunit I
MEAGWTVTEVSRQPWIVYRIMLTGSAVTPASGVVVTLVVILVLYAIMTVVSIGVPMSPMAATCWWVRGCSLSVALPGRAPGTGQRRPSGRPGAAGRGWGIHRRSRSGSAAAAPAGAGR